MGATNRGNPLTVCSILEAMEHQDLEQTTIVGQGQDGEAKFSVVVTKGDFSMGTARGNQEAFRHHARDRSEERDLARAAAAAKAEEEQRKAFLATVEEEVQKRLKRKRR